MIYNYVIHSLFNITIIFVDGHTMKKLYENYKIYTIDEW